MRASVRACVRAWRRSIAGSVARRRVPPRPSLRALLPGARESPGDDAAVRRVKRGGE